MRVDNSKSHIVTLYFCMLYEKYIDRTNELEYALFQKCSEEFHATQRIWDNHCFMTKCTTSLQKQKEILIVDTEE